MSSALAEAVEASNDLAIPETSPEPSRDLSISEGAQTITERRGDERDFDEISYRKSDGERTDSRKTVKLSQAVEDLTGYREGKIKSEREATRTAVREHVDSVRQGLVHGQQAPQQQPVAIGYTPQQVAGQPSAWAQQMHDPGYPAAIEAFKAHYLGQLRQLDDAIGLAHQAGQPTAELLADYTRVCAELEQVQMLERSALFILAGYSEQVASAYAIPEVAAHMIASTEAVQAVYQDKLEQAAKDAQEVLDFTVQVYFSGIPELAGIKDPRHVQPVCEAIKRSDPARAIALANWYEGFQRAAANVTRLNAEVEANKKADFEKFRVTGNAYFQLAHPEMRNADIANRTMLEAREYLMRECGLTSAQIDWLASNDKTLVSFWGQETLFRATRHWRSGHTLPTKKVKPEPPVERTFKPGSAESYITSNEPERLPDSMSLRQGASILNNRRAKRR